MCEYVTTTIQTFQDAFSSTYVRKFLGAQFRLNFKFHRKSIKDTISSFRRLKKINEKIQCKHDKIQCFLQWNFLNTLILRTPWSSLLWTFSVHFNWTIYMILVKLLVFISYTLLIRHFLICFNNVCCFAMDKRNAQNIALRKLIIKPIFP